MRITQVAVGMIVWLLATAALAADLDLQAVAVTVGNEPINVGQVERERKRLSPELPADTAAAEEMRATALDACIRRALVLQELTRLKKAASEADVDQAIARLKKQLAEREMRWEDYLQKVSLSDNDLRTEVRWGLSWDAYLQEQLTEGNLQRYFQKHARQFDGTELRVAHLLLKAEPGSDRATLDKLRASAEAIRRDIASGTLTFAEAAARHSASPTANQGGDIGYIARRQPMPEAFSQAAFQLERGQISAPVETSFGIHLITCLDSKPGNVAWTEVREELRRDMTRYLFDWLADRRAKDARVSFTGSYPYHDPLSRSVVRPR